MRQSGTDDAALAESRFGLPSQYDPHPDSQFSPLPRLGKSKQARKEQALAGQHAEINHLLQPEYQSSVASRSDQADGAAAESSRRSAGGQAGVPNGKGRMGLGLGLRHTQSTATMDGVSNPGIYVDAAGTIHDQAYNPFAGLTEASRKATRRRSAFGSEKRRGASEGSTSSEDGDVDGLTRGKARGAANGHGVTEEEIRRKLEAERRDLDNMSIHRAAQRQNQERPRSGRGSPSIHSASDPPFSAGSAGPGGMGGRARSAHGSYVRSPLSPTFGPPPSASSYRTGFLPPTAEGNGSDGTPEKNTEHTNAAHLSPDIQSLTIGTGRSVAAGTRTKRSDTQSTHSAGQKVTVGPDKKITVVGFDAPRSPIPPATPMSTATSNPHSDTLKPPADLSRPHSSMSRSSTDAPSRRPKPRERTKEELFPETPAQAKQREERAKRLGQSMGGSRLGGMAQEGSSSTPRSRVLPEILIVEDDDPRIIVPETGRTTRVQTVHDHVIRGPFALAMNAQGQGADPLGSRRSSVDVGKPGSMMSGGSQLEGGGYLPSRWRNGDTQLRETEEMREMYRPQEWKAGGGEEDWR